MIRGPKPRRKPAATSAELLKFVKGKFKIGEEEVSLGTEYIAHVNQIARGYVKFLGRQAR